MCRKGHEIKLRAPLVSLSPASWEFCSSHCLTSLQGHWRPNKTMPVEAQGKSNVFSRSLGCLWGQIKRFPLLGTCSWQSHGITPCFWCCWELTSSKGVRSVLWPPVSDKEAVKWLSEGCTRTWGQNRNEKVALAFHLRVHNTLDPSLPFSIFRLLDLIFLPPKCFLFENVYISILKASLTRLSTLKYLLCLNMNIIKYYHPDIQNI